MHDPPQIPESGSPAICRERSAWTAFSTSASRTSAGESTATETSDVELFRWISSGDVTAFEMLYERYGRLMFSLCLRLLHEPTEAEEVTQEAFLRVWCQARRYDPARGTAATWLLTITHHLTIDHVRRRRSDAVRNSHDMDAVTAVAVEDPGDQAVAKVLSSQIRRAMRGLPPEQRQAIWLTHFAGFTQREAAGALALPLGTVKSRVRLGLQNLRRAVGGSGRNKLLMPLGDANSVP